MKLGVYICDRGQSPNGIRELHPDPGHYVIGRPTAEHHPDIALHHGYISQRHAILMHEDPGYWTVTSLGRNGSMLYRDGRRKSLSRGDAIALEDDDRLEVFGEDFSITFKLYDLEETVEVERHIETLDQEDDATERNELIKLAIAVYQEAGPIEKVLLIGAVVAIAITVLAYLLR